MEPPPFGSLVRYEPRFDGVRIVVPKKKRTLSEIGGACFLVFWLCGWAFGEYFASQALFKNGLSGGGWFVAVWLGGWTVGGVLAFSALIKMIRGEKAEEVILSQYSLVHVGKKRREFEKERLGKIELEGVTGDHRLYFDYDAQRIYVGGNLKEPEREWLFKIMRDWKKA